MQQLIYTVCAATLCSTTSHSYAQHTNQYHEIHANDASTHANFGTAIAIDHNFIAVGADGDNNFRGATYIFDVESKTQIVKIIPSDANYYDRFGYAIAFNNGILAVSSIGDEDNGPNSGSVYLFDTIQKTQIAKLVPKDGAEGDLFGISLAIDDGIIAIGSMLDDDNGTNSGSVYIFDTSTGQQLHKIHPIDPMPEHRFGIAVAVHNDTIAVGTNYSTEYGIGSGEAYTFDVHTGEQLTKLTPLASEPENRFGTKIAIENGIVAVGAPLDDAVGKNSGSVYLFDAQTGVQRTKLLPIDGFTFASFGNSIAMDQGRVAIGAWSDYENGTRSGSAYLFDAITGNQLRKLVAKDGMSGDSFGDSIAINNGIIACGTPLDSDITRFTGSAYIFNLNCSADFNDDGSLDSLDALTFLNAFTNNNPDADFTNDGHWNFFDVSAFVIAYTQGCQYPLVPGREIHK